MTQLLLTPTRQANSTSEHHGCCSTSIFQISCSFFLITKPNSYTTREGILGNVVPVELDGHHHHDSPDECTENVILCPHSQTCTTACPWFSILTELLLPLGPTLTGCQNTYIIPSVLCFGIRQRFYNLTLIPGWIAPLSLSITTETNIIPLPVAPKDLVTPLFPRCT